MNSWFIYSRSLFASCLTWIIVLGSSTASSETVDNPNLAPEAKISANSESLAGRKYFAKWVADGRIPVQDQAFADDGLEQTVWSVDGAKDGNQKGWIRFDWPKEIAVREIQFFQKSLWTLDESWKDYSVHVSDDGKPVATGTLERKSGPQTISLRRTVKTKSLTIRFSSSYGGPNPGASEIMIFSTPATTRDMLLAMGGWKLATNPYFFLHQPSFDLDDPTPQSIAHTIAALEKKFGNTFDSKRFRNRLEAIDAGRVPPDFNDFWGYRLSNLEKLQLQVLLFDQDQKTVPMIPAFPGAEGFGAGTIGGRGGRVIEVTNLKDDGEGSFRAACEASGPRTVVFKVAGTIRLEKPLVIKNPFITIAGQSAPGDGICVQGYGIDVYAHNVIIRFIRNRPGDVLGKPIGDAISGRFIHNVIIDHCSMSWTMDEVCTWYLLGNVTVQWCIMAESLDRSLHHKGAHGAGHATGGLNFSSHHNLIANNGFRNPRFGGCGNLKESIVDFRNNVIYNFVTSAYGGEGGTYNYINNYYKRGPNSKSGHFLTPYAHRTLGYAKWHITGNVMEGNPAMSEDNWRGVDRQVPRADRPFDSAAIRTESASESLKSVLRLAGAIVPGRDAVDDRIVKEFRTNKGRIINSQKDVGGYPELKAASVPKDSDRDGMPDAWEKANGLDPSDGDDHRLDSDRDGYSNLEEYLDRTDPQKFVDYRKPENNVHTFHDLPDPSPASTTQTSQQELHLVHDGKPIEKNMQQTDMDAEANPFWKDWTQRKGQTVDGLFVLDPRDKNIKDFPANQSVLGDCEFRVVFSCDPTKYGERGGGRGPWIRMLDRGSFGFLDKGKKLTTSVYPGPLPINNFDGPSPVNLADDKLHSMSVKRVGKRLVFKVDGKKVTEQEIDTSANLIFRLAPMESQVKLESIKLTADRFSDKVTTNFKSAATISMLFDGSGKPQETVIRESGDRFRAARIVGRKYAPGKAAVYRIPAMVVSPKGTLLVFAEARASGFDWGNIRLVVRRSADLGKTWGPEIDTTQGLLNANKTGNPVPIVDGETGRIFLVGHTAPAGHVHSGKQQIFMVFSDDDGVTWSKPRLIPMSDWLPKGFSWMLTGPGHGIQLTTGKHKGRLVIPCYGEGTGYVVYSDDHGKTWIVGAHATKGPFNEATCVELSNGNVMLNMRSPGGGGHRQPHRGMAVLSNGGATYKKDSARFVPELPCASCQGGTVRWIPPGDGKPGTILFAGPGRSTGRYGGTLYGSFDDGKTWPVQRQIYQGPYGYSDIATLPNGKVACVFELNKQDLMFTVIDGPNEKGK